MNQENQEVETTGKVQFDELDDIASENTETLPSPESESAEPETADQIRAEIEATRDEMSQTIDAIQEKLDPQHIKEQLVEKAHDATIGRVQELAHNAAKQIGPAAEKIGDTGEKVIEAVKPAVHTAQEKSAPLLDFARRNPAIIAGGAVAVSVLWWGVSRLGARLRS